MRGKLSVAIVLATLATVSPAALSAATPDVGFKAFADAGSRAYQRSDFAEAEKQYKNALSSTDKLPASQSQMAKAIVLTNLGATYLAQDKLSDAEQAYKQSLEIKEKLLGKDHASVADTLQHYAACLRRQKRAQDAQDAELRADLIEIQEAAKKTKSAPGAAHDTAKHESAEEHFQSATAQQGSQNAGRDSAHMAAQITRVIVQTLNDKEQLWNPTSLDSPRFTRDQLTADTHDHHTLDFVKDLGYLQSRYQLTPATAERAVKALYEGGSIIELSNGWLMVCKREVNPRVWYHGMNVKLVPSYVSGEQVYAVRSGSSEFIATVLAER